MEDFRFTTEHNSTQIADIGGFLLKPRLFIPGGDYPDMGEWVDKAVSEIDGNIKRAIVAYHGRNLVGSIVYQQHKTQPNLLEIKNISVEQSQRGRYVGSFLLRNAEIEGSKNDFPNTEKAVVDTKVANTAMLSFLFNHNYKLETTADLYGLNAGVDALLVKELASSGLSPA